MQQEGTESTGGVQAPDALETESAPEAVEVESASEAPEVGEDGPKDESVRDTVARALEEERAKLAGNDGSEKPAPGAQAQEKPAKADAAKQQKPVKADRFDPPQRLSAKQKEVFNALPPPLKAAVGSLFAEHERTFTAAMIQTRQAEANARSVVEAVQPFATKWAERGFTVPSAIAALAAANERLTDEKTKREAYLALGRDIGIDFDEVAAIARGEAPAAQAGAGISSHPEIVALRQELAALRSEREQSVTQQVQQTAQSIAAELAAVRDEQDQFGRYLYPEMHEEGFFERAKPLVSGLRATIPGLSYADALKRAYSALTGNQTGNSQQPNQARFPAKQEPQQRALSAAVSVRGRTMPQTTGTLMPDKIPDSVRETTRMALEQLRRGT